MIAAVSFRNLDDVNLHDAPEGSYGLIIYRRVPGDGSSSIDFLYALEVNNRGEVAVWRREVGGEVYVWLSPEDERVDMRGPDNELSVQAIDHDLVFSINGMEVASQSDGPDETGNIGILVGGDTDRILAERFTVQIPADGCPVTEPSDAAPPTTST
jgi:hypothetical protein